MEQIAIKEVQVEALHDQYDVEIALHPQLNVIYGKNGRGKTTLLHILANALEMDFDRFKRLQFRSIEIKTYNNAKLRITQDKKEELVYVELDDRRLTTIGQGQSLSEMEVASVRAALGERAVYLPAFRAILERIHGEHAYVDRDKQTELDAIRLSELQISKEQATRVGTILEARSRNENHRLTAAKTLQCRQWFGQFVPVIRYPSLIDVSSRLFEEVREATYEIGSFEQHLFSQLFTRVFEAIADRDSKVEEDVPELLQEVETALASIDSTSRGSVDVYAKIRDAVAGAQGSPMEAGDSAARILKIYVDLLKRRAQQHEASFKRIRDFERSINLFMDGKTFTIDDTRRAAGPAVIAANGTPMHLTALSSGERQVVTMIFCASRLAENRGIFLLDEPELSLHVDWQRQILGEVMKQARGRQVIACTHSPEVGAEHWDAMQSFDPMPSVAPQPGLFDDFSGDELE